MKAITVGELIADLRDNYRLDSTVIIYMLTDEDYEEACQGTPIPWEQGARTIANEANWSWLTPEIYDTMARTIGEEEENE